MKQVRVHPITEKLSSKGHPWILRDKFTDNFPKNETWLKFKNSKTKKDFYFFQDQQHKLIKGRIWGQSFKNFQEELEHRLLKAIKKRKALNLERDNLYWIFAEADHIPGLYIFSFKNIFFIQMQSNFWCSQTNQITDFLKKHFKSLEAIYLQNRQEKDAPWTLVDGKEIGNISFTEFDCKYQVDVQDPDLGFYTDMSSIRYKMLRQFKNSESVLNLFSYTGAFSIAALSQGAKQVHSVDLSAKYMTRLESNLNLNKFTGQHLSHVSSVQKFLKNCSENKQSFDTTICDLPSSSTDGKKKTNALKNYHELLPMLESVTKNNLFIFLNTHRITREKFKKEIQLIIEKNRLNLSFAEEYFLDQDCPKLKNFPEGDYLKGLYLKKR